MDLLDTKKNAKSGSVVGLLGTFCFAFCGSVVGLLLGFHLFLTEI